MTKQPIASSSLTFSRGDRIKLLQEQPTMSADIHFLVKDCAILESYYLLNKFDDEIKAMALINMIYEVQGLSRQLSASLSPMTIARKLVAETYENFADVNMEETTKVVLYKLQGIRDSDFKIKILGGYYSIDNAIKYCELLCK